MLLLERREGGVVLIGEDITVSVLKVSGGRVTLGISAPADVRVDRAEVRDRAGHSGERGAA